MLEMLNPLIIVGGRTENTVKTIYSSLIAFFFPAATPPGQESLQGGKQEKAMSEEFLVVKGTLEPSLPKQTQHCFSWAGFAPGAPNVLPKITSSNHKCKILPFTFRASHLP